MTPQKNIFCHIFFLLIFVPNWHEKLKIIFLSETAWNWKKLRKQNQSGIKFYYMWSKEFKVINSLTEISQNVDFPHFPLFEIIAQIWLIITCKTFAFQVTLAICDQQPLRLNQKQQLLFSEESIFFVLILINTENILSSESIKLHF